MLYKSVQNNIQNWHLFLTIILLSEFFYFDKKDKKYRESHGYLRRNTKALLFGARTYPLILAAHLIWKQLQADEIAPRLQTASLVIGWVEVFGIQTVACLGIQESNHVSEIVFLFNNLFYYSDEVEETMTQKKLQLDANIARNIRFRNAIIILSNIIISIFPAGVVAAITVDWEPTHVMVKDVLEIDLDPSLQNFGILFVIAWAVFCAVRVVQVGGVLGLCYLQLTDCCISAMYPIKANPSLLWEDGSMPKIRYRFQTKMWGEMDEAEIIRRIRIHQILMTVANKIYASILVSFHHLACTIIVVGMAFVLIREHNDLMSAGIIVASIAVFACVAPILIQYEEAMWVGGNSRLCQGFLKKCKSLTTRR